MLKFIRITERRNRNRMVLDGYSSFTLKGGIKNILPLFYHNGNRMRNKKGSENIDAVMSMCHKYYSDHANAVRNYEIFDRLPFDN